MRKFLVLLLMLVSVSVFAQQEWDEFNSFNNKAKTLADKDAVFFKDRVSRQYGIANSECDNLFQKFGNNWGDMVLSLELGKVTGKSIGSIQSAYNKNKGWGNIAKELGIKPGSPEFKHMKDFTKNFEAGWQTDWDKKGKANKSSGQSQGKGNGQGKGKK
jgi:hypothetical protein